MKTRDWDQMRTLGRVPRRGARSMPGLVVLAVVAAAALTSCDHQGASGAHAAGAATTTVASQDAAPAVVSNAPVTSTPTTVPTTTTAPPPPPTTAVPPPPPTTAPPAGDKFTIGSDGPGVSLLETALTNIGYRPGPVDGHYDARTASAVMAFQKREGLSRDGVAGPATMTQLSHPSGAGPRSLGGAHIEVDLDRQILFAVNGDSTFVTINISSGSGKTYDVPGGGTAKAITPVGNFAIDRKIDGNRQAPLGVLYRPMYFKGGFAVHGSPSVPGFPASHGCVRTANADQDYLFPLFAKGTPVQLYSADRSAPGAGDINPNVDPGD